MKRRYLRSHRSKAGPPFQYEKLESRQLLAGFVNGTLGDDSIEIQFITDQLVSAVVNGGSPAEIDVTDGLIVNGLDGLSDKITIDHRIKADITVVNTESLELSGGNNFVQVGASLDQSTGFAINTGIVNGNIRFSHVDTIKADIGDDQFVVETSALDLLTIEASGGDDIFWIGSQTLNSDSSQVTLFGDQGDDQFHFLGMGQANIVGSEGFDIANMLAHEFESDIKIEHFLDAEIERLFARNNANNRASSIVRFHHFDSRSYNWTVLGDWTLVNGIDDNSNQSLQLHGFNEIESATHRVEVLETTRDLWIEASQVYVGSDVYEPWAKLDTIRNQVTISDKWFDFSVNPAINRNVTDRFDVSIHNQAGQGTVFQLQGDRINFSSGGSIKFDFEQDFEVFSPRLMEIFGSDAESDYFVFEESDLATTIHGGAGDDAVFVGSTNEDANGLLDQLLNNLSFVGDTGFDQLFVNDQANESEPRLFEIEDDQIQFNSSVIDLDSVDFVRFNGSATQPNEFRVNPSAETTFFFDGASGNDKLSVIGLPSISQLNEFAKSGSWDLGGFFNSIHFQGIENTLENTFLTTAEQIKELDLNLENQSRTLGQVRTEIGFSSDARNVATAIQTTAEFESMLQRIEARGGKFPDVANRLRDADIDFERFNLVFFHISTSTISNKLIPRVPTIVSDHFQLDFDHDLTQILELILPAISNDVFAYVVDKSLTKFTFNGPDSLDSLFEIV